MRTSIVLVMLAAVSALGGCASAGNLTGKDGCQVFGGVRLDATLISESCSPDSEVVKSKVVEGPVRFGEICCGVVDMPLSVVADTLLLPITIPVSLHRSGNESKAADQDLQNDKTISSEAAPAD